MAISDFAKTDNVSFFSDAYSCCTDADALLILTDWGEFKNPNFEELHKRLRAPVIFDGRNLYDLQLMQEHAFTYIGIGRRGV